MEDLVNVEKYESFWLPSTHGYKVQLFCRHTEIELYR
jgi:hypothetical protein